LTNKLDYLYIQNWENIIHNVCCPEDKIENIYQTEAEIRDKGLQWLLKQNRDWILLLDNDEFWSLEQINKLIEYLSKDDFCAWYSIHYRNYVFDKNHYILGFCPPRVFSTNFMGRKLHSFFWDNDINYTSDGKQMYSYKPLANKPIPRNILEVKHLTWLHSNGKLKYEYQMKHFGRCGYKWNYETNQLEFNQEFHKKNNIAIPELIKDEN